MSCLNIFKARGNLFTSLSQSIYTSARMGPERTFKVAVLGAAGGVGQPLCLLLKENPQIHTLNMFDVVEQVYGVAVDLGHICTPAKVRGFVGDTKDMEKQEKALSEALQGVDVTIVTAGRAQKVGESRDDVFDKNAKIISSLIEGIAKHSPQSMTCIVTNPVNSLTPLVAECLKKHDAYDPKKLFGISILDTVRAKTFLGQMLEKDSLQEDVEVIGGHSNETILPLFSSARENLTDEKLKNLHKRVQSAADEVINAKAGGGSATLCTAYAANKFISALLAGIGGEKMTTTAFVSSDLVPGCSFFSSRIIIGEKGIETIHELPQLTDFERSELENTVIPSLQKQIAKGANYLKSE